MLDVSNCKNEQSTLQGLLMDDELSDGRLDRSQQLREAISQFPHRYSQKYATKRHELLLSLLSRIKRVPDSNQILCQFPNWDALPLELLLYVMTFLEYSDVINLSLVSKKFNAAASEDVIWNELLLRHYDYREDEIKTSPKELFKQWIRIENNWKNGICTTSTIRVGKKGISCFTIKSDRLFLGEDSGNIEEFDLNTGNLVREFRGHRNAISGLDTVDEFLVSCSRESSVRLWDLTTGAVATVYDTRVIVPLCLTAYGNKIIVGYDKGLILYWELKPGGTYPTLKDLHHHKDRVICVKAWKGDSPAPVFASCSADTRAIIWDMDEGVPLYVLPAAGGSFFTSVDFISVNHITLSTNNDEILFFKLTESRPLLKQLNEGDRQNGVAISVQVGDTLRPYPKVGSYHLLRDLEEKTMHKMLKLWTLDGEEFTTIDLTIEGSKPQEEPMSFQLDFARMVSVSPGGVFRVHRFDLPDEHLPNSEEIIAEKAQKADIWSAVIAAGVTLLIGAFMYTKYLKRK
eukprot:TRINITY_DN7077_c0_g1_i1.p1 TRINITY_DN7077_c0_g1~~TRINITY_DN7077_c0_g1_i1.p1  ORF type:complete len:516 (+),score=101.08 TRINITY_DN7077_c0_g1_i1:69-1616(+)